MITFLIFTFRLLDIDESFDLKTDQSIDSPTINNSIRNNSTLNSAILNSPTVKGLFTANDGMTLSGNSNILSTQLVVGQENKWNIHTPNYGANSMFYIAPVSANGTTDWSNELTINRTGDVNVKGDATINGNTKNTGKISTNNLSPDDFPNGWDGGLRTYDIYSSATIAAGRNKAVNSYINADGNAGFTGTVTSNKVNTNQLCIGSTCIGEENLKILTGGKSVALYQRNGNGDYPWIHVAADLNVVNWSGSQAYFTLHT